MKLKVLGAISIDEDGDWSTQFEHGVHKIDPEYEPNASEPQAIRPRRSHKQSAPALPWQISEAPTGDRDAVVKAKPGGATFPWAESEDAIRELWRKSDAELEAREEAKAKAKNNVWAYNGYSVLLSTGRRFNYNISVTDDVLLEIKHAVVKYKKRISHMKRGAGAYIDPDIIDSQRERISDQVRMFVWQRDKGSCVQCGSRERLEFDHIIPVSKGGSSTERNIQLLCETCNRSKGADI